MPSCARCRASSRPPSSLFSSQCRRRSRPRPPSPAPCPASAPPGQPRATQPMPREKAQGPRPTRPWAPIQYERSLMATPGDIPTKLERAPVLGRTHGRWRRHRRRSVRRAWQPDSLGACRTTLLHRSSPPRISSPGSQMRRTAGNRDRRRAPRPRGCPGRVSGGKACRPGRGPEAASARKPSSEPRS